MAGVAVLPTRFPEDLEFRETFTSQLLGHDFGRGPLFTHFLNPWEEALVRAELLLHQRVLHLTAWGGYELARGKVVGLHPFHPVDPPRFPFLYFRALPKEAFGSLTRDAVLMALMTRWPSQPLWLPAEIGDVNPAPPGWVGVLLRKEVSPMGLWGEGSVVFEAASESDLSLHPGRTMTIRENGTVAALRLDAIAALAHRPSREQFKRLVENGGALLNYRPVNKGAVSVRSGDVISLRGFPSVVISEVSAPNKKGRLGVRVESI